MVGSGYATVDRPKTGIRLPSLKHGASTVDEDEALRADNCIGMRSA
jgi:hypothetical protein